MPSPLKGFFACAVGKQAGKLTHMDRCLYMYYHGSNFMGSKFSYTFIKQVNLKLSKVVYVKKTRL